MTEKPTSLRDFLGSLVAADQGRHVRPEQLLAYRNSELEGEERDDIQDHLAYCRECSRTLLDIAGHGSGTADPELDLAWDAFRLRLAEEQVAEGLDPSDCLRDLEDQSPVLPALARIEKAVRQVEVEEPPSAVAVQASVDPVELVAGIAKCPLAEQRRRLRFTLRYRDPLFAGAYLGHLDALRDHDADEAAKLVEAAVIHLIPLLGAPREERIALQCKALGVYGSTQRMKAQFSTAAKALRLGLELSRRHRLPRLTAELLQRGAYVLRDQLQCPRALTYLREALEIYSDLDSYTGIGKVLIDFGIIHSYLGEHETAIRMVKRSLRYLESSAEAPPRSVFAAYQVIAFASEELNDLEACELWLKRAVDALEVLEAKGSVNWAKLTWMRGNLSYKQGDYRHAESYLWDAEKILSDKGNPILEALISVDIVKVLLAQDKLKETCQVAKNMTRTLVPLQRNEVIKATLLEFARRGIEGTLTHALVLEARKELERASVPEALAP